MCIKHIKQFLTFVEPDNMDCLFEIYLLITTQFVLIAVFLLFHNCPKNNKRFKQPGGDKHQIECCVITTESKRNLAWPLQFDFSLKCSFTCFTCFFL